MYYLLVLLLAPIAAALIASFASGKDGDASYRLGLLLSLAIAGLGVPLITCMTNLHVEHAWFTLWGTNASVGLRLASDGLSGWLIQLVTFLTSVAILGARAQVGSRMREFLACVFVMQALMIGALLARDLVVFYLCYEGMLIPMVVLIALFGGAERRAAAMWFFLYTMLASVFMLVGIWYIAYHLQTTDLALVVASAGGLPREAMLPLFLAFAVAFAVKVPLVPLHGWQAKTYAETPGAVVALLGGAMSKLGIYGFLRFVLPIFPHESVQYADWFIVLGLIGTVGGALVAIVQDDAKRMLAYSSLSHLGLVMVGIFSFDPAALNGAAVQMVAHGLSVAALFVLVGVVEARTKSAQVDDFGALVGRAPVMAVLFVIAALASAALPGTANFVGEIQLLFGTYRGIGFAAALIAGLSVIFGVVYLLILIQRWFYGRAGNLTDQVTDLRPGEVLAVLPLLIASFFFGFYPKPIASQAGVVAEALGAAPRAVMRATAEQPQSQPAAIVVTTSAVTSHP